MKQSRRTVLSMLATCCPSAAHGADTISELVPTRLDLCRNSPRWAVVFCRNHGSVCGKAERCNMINYDE